MERTHRAIAATLIRILDPVPGEFLIMPPLESETIPDNVTATQSALDLPEMVGPAQLFLPAFAVSSSDESESYCNTP